MNICHVNLASGFSGGENQTLELIKQQIKMGYELTVVANPRSPFAYEVQQLPCNLVTAKHFLLQHSSNITAGTQCIHVHEGRALYWAFIQHVITKTPYIITRRIDNPMKERILLKLGYKKAKAVVALSQEIKRQVLISLPNIKTEVIPSSPVTYPVDPEQVQAIKSKKPGKFNVIQAGKMYQHKGFDVTVEAAKLLQETAPNIQFYLLGDGPEQEQLKESAKGLGNIHFMGRQTNMGDWFATADLQIHPSYSEGLGSVILEGMKAGLPVIGSNAGGIPDIIEDNFNGRLIEPGNAKQLAGYITELASNPEKARTFIDQGKEKLAMFDISNTAIKYESLYQQ